MSKMLVVMRHGKAQSRDAGIPDEERTLTAPGRRALQSRLKEMLKLCDIEKGAQVEVWSSATGRTWETAELLMDALRKRGVPLSSPVKGQDALRTEDSEALLAQVAKSDADVIFAVGHNPATQDMVRLLTGDVLTFAPGAMAAVRLGDDIDDESTGENRLLWFVQGPEVQRWKTLTTCEHVMASANRRLKKRTKDFLEHPEDPETLHKLRVSIRTLRSLTAFLKPFQDADQNAQVQSDLRDVVLITSSLRELDVLSERVGHKDDVSPELQKACQDLAADERAKVIKALTSKYCTKRLKRVDKVLDGGMAWRKDVERNGLARKDLQERFAQMVDRLQDELENLDLADARHTHQVRKMAKRVRYVGENFKDLLSEDALAVSRKAVAEQDRLGELCDARVDLVIFDEFPRDILSERAQWDLNLLRAETEEFLYTTLRDAHDGAGEGVGSADEADASDAVEGDEAEESEANSASEAGDADDAAAEPDEAKADDETAETVAGEDDGEAAGVDHAADVVVEADASDAVEGDEAEKSEANSASETGDVDDVR
jgi:CHAD domain-containing protein/phosphohistidine phosphatase SixA